jgi:hypothetical protein
MQCIGTYTSWLYTHSMIISNWFASGIVASVTALYISLPLSKTLKLTQQALQEAMIAYG